MKRMVLGFIIGLILGIFIFPVGAYLYIRLGYAPVATKAAPFPLEKRLAAAALKARISREAPRQSPVPANEENLLAGAKVYAEYCAVCHGMNKQPKTAIAKGMYPVPPQLFEGMGVMDDPVGETYWKVANGIRLTGMPAFGGSLSGTQMWQVSQLLASAGNLSPAVSNVISSPPPAK